MKTTIGILTYEFQDPNYEDIIAKMLQGEINHFDL
jgi:hypothetical protein